MSSCSAIHPNGRLLAVGITNGVGFWDIDRDVSVGSLPIGLTISLLFEPSGDLVTMGRTGLARWPVHPSPGDSNSLRVGPPDLLSTAKGERIARSRDGRILACCQDYASPIVLDLDHPESPIRLGPQADVRYIAISPDGRWAATGSHNSQGWGQSLVTPRRPARETVPESRDVRQPPIQSRRALARDESGQRAHACGRSANGGKAPASRGARFHSPPTAVSWPSRSRPDRCDWSRPRPGGWSPAWTIRSSPARGRQRSAADGSRLILAGEDSRAAHVWDLRAIRHELVAIGLDWDWPPLPEPDVTTPAAGPLRVVTDLGGHDFSWGGFDPQELDRLNEALEIDPGDLHAMLRRGRISIDIGPLRSSHRRLYAGPRDPAGRSQNPRGRGEAYLSKKAVRAGVRRLRGIARRQP